MTHFRILSAFTLIAVTAFLSGCNKSNLSVTPAEVIFSSSNKDPQTVTLTFSPASPQLQWKAESGAPWVVAAPAQAQATNQLTLCLVESKLPTEDAEASVSISGSQIIAPATIKVSWKYAPSELPAEGQSPEGDVEGELEGAPAEGQTPSTPPPSPPKVLSGAKEVILRWNPSTDVDLKGYRLYRNGLPLTGGLIPGTMYRDTTGVSGKSYSYSLSTVDDSNGESASSEPVEGGPGLVTLSTPDSIAGAGSLVRIPIGISNANGLSATGFSVTIQYDASLISSIVAKPSAITAGMTITQEAIAPGLIRFSLSSSTATLIGQGALFFLEIQIRSGDTYNLRETRLRIATATVYTEDSVAVTIKTNTNGSILATRECQTGDTLHEFGDIADDCQITDADASLALDFTIGKSTPVLWQFLSGDINSDSLLDAADAVMLFRAAHNLELSPEKVLQIPQNVRVSAGRVTALPSKGSLRVPVLISDATNLASLTITVAFGSELLLERFEPGPLLEGFASAWTSGEGYVRGVVAGDAPNAFGAGIAAYIYFDLKPGVTTGTEIKVSVNGVNLTGAYGENFDWSTPVIPEDGVVIVGPPNTDLTVTLLGNGTVTPAPGIHEYAQNTEVNLVASPQPGWRFKQWSGDLSGATNPTTIIMTQSKSVVAEFEKIPYALQLLAEGEGTVTTSPSQLEFSEGTKITVTAEPAEGWQFDHWENGITGTTNPAVFTMGAMSASITAVFTEIPIPVWNLVIDTQGSGNVALSPEGGTYQNGTSVTLTATATGDYDFHHWEGDIVGLEAVANLVMDANKTATAVFVQRAKPSLNVAVAGKGYVDVSPQGESSDRGLLYDPGTTVTLLASAADLYRFDRWEGSITGNSNPVQLDITQDKQVTAVFEELPPGVFTVQGPASSVGGSLLIASPITIPLTDTPISFAEGTILEIWAIPQDGYLFTEWTSGLTGTNPKTTTVLTGNLNVIANFAEVAYTVSFETQGLGSVSKTPDQADYRYGDPITFTATPSSGWGFHHWEGTFYSEEASVSTTVASNYSLRAVFVRTTRTLTRTAVGSGTITTTPDSSVYFDGDSVECVAEPAQNWAFDHWEGDVSGTTPSVNFTLDKDFSVVAVFTPIRYTLSVFQTGQGSIATDPVQPDYAPDSIVQVQATPAEGWLFDHWEGDLVSSLDTASLTMDHDYSILAVFVPARYTLTTEAIGMGTVQRDLQQADYGYGDIVTLTAVPLPGWLFVEWVGDITGTAPELTVTIHTNKTVNALFIQEEYPLTTHVTGNGSILQDPNMALYPSGSLVSLSAEPDTAWYFDHWEGDLTGSENTPTLTMTTPKDVTAVFSEMAAITTDTLGTGTVQVTPDQNYYLPTDTPILQADPAPGWRFDRWEGDVFVADYANSAQLTLSPVLSSRQITAVFIQKFTLLLSSQGEGSLSMEPGPYWLDAGTTGNITATPALGWHFVEWSGSYTGSESVTSYVMDGNKTVTATFAPDEYASPLYMLIEGRGSVQAVPDKPSYLQGESVILTAVPASSGSAFYQWQGDGVGDPYSTVQTITVTGPEMVYTVIFKETPVDQFGVGFPISMSVSSDDAYALISTSDRTTRKWRIADSTMMGSVQCKKNNIPCDVTDSHYSPNGITFFVADGGKSNTVWLYDSLTTSLIKAIPSNLPSSKQSAAYVSGGSTLCLPDASVLAKYDAATGTELDSIPAHEATISAVSSSSDGEKIITAAVDGIARLWVANDFGLVQEFATTGTGYPNAAAISPDKQTVALADDSGGFELFSVATGLLTGSYDCGGAPFISPSTSLEFSSSGAYILNARQEDICVYEVPGYSLILPTFKALPFRQNGVFMQASEQALFAETEVWVTTLPVIETVGTIAGAMSNPILNMAVSPSGDLLYTVVQEQSQRKLYVTDTVTRITTQSMITSYPVEAFAYTSGGGASLVAVVDQMNSYLGLVTVFSEPDDILYCTIDAPDALYPSHLSFSGVGDSILVAGDTEAYLFAVPSGAVVSTLAANTESISCVKVAPDGSFCVLGHYNGTASVMDSETGSITATLSGHVASVSSVSISLESDLIATSSNTLSDHTIRLWNLDGSLYGIINDTNSGGTVQFLSKALIEALTGIDQGGIFCGYGSVVTFYNYAGTSMTRFGPEFGHWSPIIAMDIAANGYNGRVYTASDDGVVYSWYLY